VNCQAVISGCRESGHRCETSDALVGTMPVALVDPGVESCGALLRVSVGEAVTPLGQGRLDEAFSLAVGLRPIGTGQALCDVQAAAGSPELSLTDGRTVVGPCGPDPHAGRAMVGNRVVQALHRTWCPFIRVQIGAADACLIIDGDDQKLPADRVAALLPGAADAVAVPGDAAEPFDVDIQQIASGCAVVT